jgi:predicted transcriptional regulator
LRRHYGRRLGFGRDALAEGKRLIFFLRHGRLAEPRIRRIGIKFWGHGINPLFCGQFCCAGCGFCSTLPRSAELPGQACGEEAGHEIQCRSLFLESTTEIPMKSIFNSSSRGSVRQLGPLEQGLLEALWLRGTATVRELLQDSYQDLAYTTVMTTLDRLYKKNLLTREAEGRAFRYAPRVTRQELHWEVAGEAFRQLLDASPAASLPLSYLVEILTERDAQLLDSLREVVESKRRELRDGGSVKRESVSRDSGRKEKD